MRAQAIQEAKIQTTLNIMVFDVPLLFETNGDKRVDRTIVVSASQKTQRERVLARPWNERRKTNFDPNEANA